jgi:hypothetical protein
MVRISTLVMLFGLVVFAGIQPSQLRQSTRAVRNMSTASHVDLVPVMPNDRVKK